MPRVTQRADPAGAGAATQPVLDGMPRRLLPATPTRLGTWLDCPRRYQYVYLDKRPGGGAWAHQSYGTSIHNALREWFTLPPGERTPAAGAALVRRGWIGGGYRDDAQRDRWREQAAGMVADYLAEVDPHTEPRGLERTVATTTPVLALSGRIDRLDSRPAAGGEELVVVDYKTGRRVPSEDDVCGSSALAVYAVAAARTLRRPCTRVELHHLPSGAVIGWRHSPEALARHLARLDDVGREAAAAEAAWRADGAPLAASTGPLCGWCDHRRWCPEGQRAAPARASWEGLAAWEEGEAAVDALPEEDAVAADDARAAADAPTAEGLPADRD